MQVHSKVVLFDIDYTLFNTDVFRQLEKHELYEEVEELLKELSTIATIGVFSEGEENRQLLKLKNTGIIDFFLTKNVHIVAFKEQELERVLNTYKGKTLFFVDDKLPILKKAKEVFPDIFTIWVKRGKYAAVQQPIEGFTPDKIVEDLSQILQIVKSYKE
jgi:FMN phosphatase YigB (HAD superfamily)